jgi:hypothetical protein
MGRGGSLRVSRVAAAGDTTVMKRICDLRLVNITCKKGESRRRRAQGGSCCIRFRICS